MQCWQYCLRYEQKNHGFKYKILFFTCKTQKNCLSLCVYSSQLAVARAKLSVKFHVQCYQPLKTGMFLLGLTLDV
jgi:hypothetical protein